MIPNDLKSIDFHGSYGEKSLYNALSNLPDRYVIFHSVSWHRNTKDSHRIAWGESDFTVFDPRRGLLVIEVKSGGISYKDGKWRQINTLTNQESLMKDPLLQAFRSKYTFIDLLRNNHTTKQYWIEPAVCFPLIDQEEIRYDLPPSYSLEMIITRSDLNDIEGKINRIYDFYKMHSSPYSESDVDWVMSSLSPQFDAIPNVLVTIDEHNFVFNRLTQEQSLILDYMQEQQRAAIHGGAGTGKTMIAIEKAKLLAVDSKVLFLCFNRFLLQSLRSAHSAENPNIDFYNLPSLVKSLCKSEEEISNEYISRVLNEYDYYGWDYQHIIIDEGQDFFEDHIILLKTISDIQGGCLYIFYDKNQLVQQKQNISWSKEFDCRLVLSLNCRNTKNIALTSYQPIGIQEIKMRLEVAGDKPTITLENSVENAISTIATIIRKYTDSGIQRKDIVILTAKTEERSFLFNHSKVGNYKLTNIPGDNGILFTSSRKYKGLEATVTILIDLDEQVFSDEEACRVFYVGTSRAKHFLEMVSVVNDYQLKLMAILLNKDIQSKPKAVISSALKVKVLDNRK